MSNIFEGRLFIFNMNNMTYERRICTCCIAELLSLNLQVYELYNSVFFKMIEMQNLMKTHLKN